MKKTKILIPVYNDWESVSKLLEDINKGLDGWGSDIAEVSVLIINDGSTENRPVNNSIFENLNSIKIINMKENKGHARCNASAIRYIFKNEKFDYAILMDSDGEDRPEEITDLISTNTSFDSVTIKRGSEIITGDYGILDTNKNSYKVSSNNSNKVKVIISNTK